MTVMQRAAAVGIVVSGLFLGAAVTVHADDHDCDERIHKAERRLRTAIEKYGDASQEAKFRRHEVKDIREHCEHHWDHDHDHDYDHRHHDHDLDHDHDHDHDED